MLLSCSIRLLAFLVLLGFLRIICCQDLFVLCWHAGTNMIFLCLGGSVYVCVCACTCFKWNSLLFFSSAVCLILYMMIYVASLLLTLLFCAEIFCMQLPTFCVYIFLKFDLLMVWFLLVQLTFCCPIQFGSFVMCIKLILVLIVQFSHIGWTVELFEFACYGLVPKQVLVFTSRNILVVT